MIFHGFSDAFRDQNWFTVGEEIRILVLGAENNRDTHKPDWSRSHSLNITLVYSGDARGITVRHFGIFKYLGQVLSLAFQS